MFQSILTDDFDIWHEISLLFRGRQKSRYHIKILKMLALVYLREAQGEISLLAVVTTRRSVVLLYRSGKLQSETSTSFNIKKKCYTRNARDTICIRK